MRYLQSFKASTRYLFISKGKQWFTVEKQVPSSWAAKMNTTGNVTNQNHRTPDWMQTEALWYHFCDNLNLVMRKQQTNQNWGLQNNWRTTFQSIKDMKVKETSKNCFGVKGTKQTWKLKASCQCEMDPDVLRDLWQNLNGIWGLDGSNANFLIVMWLDSL